MECPYKGNACECGGEVIERPGNTSYIYTEQDKLDGKPNPNILLSCEAHYQLHYDTYQELWDEYWRDRL